jgi:hypothetical protein
MPLNPNSLDLQSKIPRAIRALIISTGVGNAGNTYAAFAASMSINRGLPNTTIICDGEGMPDELGTGNFRFPEVRIIFRDNATPQPNQDPRQ